MVNMVYHKPEFENPEQPSFLCKAVWSAQPYLTYLWQLWKYGFAIASRKNKTNTSRFLQ